MRTSIFLLFTVSFFALSCSKTDFKQVQTENSVLEELKLLTDNQGEFVPVEHDFSKSILQGMAGEAYFYYSESKNEDTKQGLFVLKSDNNYAKGIPEQSWYGTLVVQEFGSGYLIGCAGDADNCMEVKVDGRTWIVTH